MIHKQILFASPYPAESQAFRAAFKQAYPSAAFDSVASASEMLDRIQDQGVHEISFVLLDLDLPGLQETSTLTRLSEDVQFLSLPVVVMSDTDEANDVMDTYRLGVSAFIGKPHDDASRLRSAQAMAEFWLDINVTPKPKVAMF